MQGISSKAAGGVQNKFNFSGKELNSNEFYDGAGLEIYDFHARNYDPQIGRFHSVDPLAEQFHSWNPYTYSYNNPVRFGDPTGMSSTDWVGKKNGEGSTTWKWDDNITSAEQAKEAGYDSYQAPGSTLENAKIGDGPVATVYFGKSKAEGIGYDESNFTNWSAVNGSKYDNPLQAYKAWQSDAGYHRGESFGDRLSRIVGYFSYEARRDYASGGMNMYGGYGTATRVLTSAEGAATETETLSALRPTHYLTRSRAQMQNLLDDIRVNGIKEPIQYIEDNGVKHIVGGNHRYFAAQKLGIQQVPVQQVNLPFQGYITPLDFMLEGKMPGYWKYLK